MLSRFIFLGLFPLLSTAFDRILTSQESSMLYHQCFSSIFYKIRILFWVEIASRNFRD
ncbi:hypothetical protein OnM2_c2613o33 [Erysiphe neolycopersici]|uniref:Uncharacterized protein n=1 Tax=Erysiphe neolycopersici TaxID=212602 RepID=A0A420HZB5_9PEZI|nr:hypothetical protein OnM2_c2613o33 [Erysiphe neolycopersici]